MINARDEMVRPQLWQLADLLDYPSGDYGERVPVLCREIRGACGAEAGRLLDMFAVEVLQIDADRLEEIHTRTFSLAPVCPPYVGLQIFGENNFKRGDFIAMLARDLERYQINVYPELADHVGSMLRLAACQSAEELEEMLTWCFCDPVRKMAEGLGGTDSPYRHLFAAIAVILDDLREGVGGDA